MKNNPQVQAALQAKFNETPAARMNIVVRDVDGKWIGSLCCVDSAMVSDESIISALTAWRKRYMRYFLTQFEATATRTRDWLNSIVIPCSDRILFIIILPTGELVGNFGVCNLTKSTGELDNLIRGERGGDKKLIFYSELALLSWMFGKLQYVDATLHVFSNNLKTIKLHSAVGFEVRGSGPLKRRFLTEGTEYFTGPSDGNPMKFSYLEMGLEKRIFLKRNPWVPHVYKADWS